MAMGKLAFIAVALGLVIGGLGAAVTDSRPLGQEESVALATDDARKDDPDDDVAAADADEGDGDRTAETTARTAATTPATGTGR